MDSRKRRLPWKSRRELTASRPRRSPPRGFGRWFTSFLAELKRRRVIRVLGAYAAVGFLVIQAADPLLRGLGIPGWAFSLIVVVTVLGAPVAVVLAWAYDLTPAGITRTPSLPPPAAPAPRPGMPTDARPHPRESLAVLPFVNLSDLPENEYFSDGMTEELIAALARIGGLRVVSRTSVMNYKRTTKSLGAVADELNVGTVLEGSVRRYGERVRVTAQLIDAAEDRHLWVETYDRTLQDIFEIQADVARRIAVALEVELSPRDSKRLDRPPTDSAEAYDLYLRGRFWWNARTEESLRQAVGYFERALAVDPGFAVAATGLADAHLMLGIYGFDPPREVMEQTRRAAGRALALDGSLGGAVAVLGCIRAVHDWDWNAAEAEFRRAIELSPRDPLAHQWFAINLLAPLARFADARRELAVARELDPFSVSVQTSQAMLLYFERRHGEAAAAYGKLLAAHPGFGPGHSFLGQTLAVQERFGAAVDALREAVRLTERGAEAIASLAHALARAGEEGEARALLEELRQRSRRRYVPATLFAHVHLGLGQPERALESLQRAYEQRAADLVWVGVRPLFDPLRELPGFRELLQRMGLR